MAILKMLHSTTASLFLLSSISLSTLYFLINDKGDIKIRVLAKAEWFFSSLIFFLGILLLMLLPFWLQVGLFHAKIVFSMIGIGMAQYFYKQYEIAKTENNYPKFLYYFRILIPSFIFLAYYLGNKLLMA